MNNPNLETHVIAGLFSTDPNLPVHLFCRLIKQFTLKLNLLRRSRFNPRFQNTQHWRAHSISIQYHLPLQDSKWSFMKIHIQEVEVVRGLVHWTIFGALYIPPDIIKHSKILKGWRYSKVVPTSQKYYIHIFSR